MTRRSKRTRKQRDFYEPGAGEANGDQILNRKRVSLKEFGTRGVASENESSSSEEEFQPRKKAKTSTKKPQRKRAGKNIDHSDLFRSLSTKNVAVVQVAREWLGRFRKNEAKATNEIVNFGRLNV